MLYFSFQKLEIYIASIKKSNISTTFEPHLQQYFNSILYNLNI